MLKVVNRVQMLGLESGPTCSLTWNTLSPVDGLNDLRG